jgi:hypothetical protein
LVDSGGNDAIFLRSRFRLFASIRAVAPMKDAVGDQSIGWMGRSCHGGSYEGG